ncbi:MAG TPA: alginate lyase family protein [Puia sp.]|uniref:alginate lyase family protein n=1 Tax=Puia sp. TaxID=2045100 RepID=UPI002C9FC788|nr:alginate lyase family protein [Puia sp.]HVU94739.1 alginate lyase family protein [Puia sp.]
MNHSLRFLLFALFAVALSGVRAQKSTRLIDGWEFTRQDLGGVWEAVRAVPKGGPESVPAWRAVRLPHCVNARDGVDPDGNYYQGPAWYRTRLALRQPYPGGRVLLRFEGAGQATEVYVYTTKVGGHVGGYDEWTVDITDAVAACERDSSFVRRFGGMIPVEVRTDNSRDLERIPSAMSDFSVYGGLYRYVDLVYVPAVSFAGLFADVRVKGKDGFVGVRAELYRPTGEPVVGYSVVLKDAEGKVVSEMAELGTLTVQAPRLWSPDRPVLYRLFVTVNGANGGVCTDSTDIGFRSYSFVDHGPFLFNGSRLLIRGTSRHEDAAGEGAAMTEEEMRREMVLMKEMGVNFVRLAHYQQSRIILHLCDSLGILVWEEIPWCRGGLGGDRYREQARRMMRNMISQHYNHPAVILWGLGNENDWPGDFPGFDTAAIRGFMTELNGIAHRLDPGRKTAIRRCDFCKDIPDVYSPSIWAGWYRGIYTEYTAATEEEFKKVPHFIHMEWGGDSHAGRHSENPDKVLPDVRSGQGTDERAGDASLYGGAARVSKDGDWSETYICNLFDWTLKEQSTMPWLTGTAQWVFKDFSTPLRPENPVPYVNQKGVVERDGTPKEGYYVFQSYWAPALMAHIYGHSWPVRWGAEGETRMVKVYSNAGEAELFVNGVSAGVRHRNSADFPAAGLRWPVKFHRGSNHLTVIARRGDAVVRDSLDLAYQTEKWGKPARMAMDIVDQRGDTALARVRLLDGQGVPCLDAATTVHWGQAGDGRLVDDLGTSTGSRVVQAFNGVSMIRVVLRGGKSVVSVSAEGMPTAFLEVKAQDPDIVETLRPFVLKEAAAAMNERPVTVTASHSPRSAGGRHDFFSEADYFWPNPVSPDSPYINRDGQTNPENFNDHRRAMIRLSRIVGALASAWKLTHDDRYVRQALLHCRAWFVDTATLMHPDLQFSQAIKGRVTGRNFGIIDSIHFMEVVEGLEAMEASGAMDAGVLAKIKDWFARYLRWLTTHPYGVQEMNTLNNHSTCWVMQVAAFARFTGNDSLMEFCRERYKKVLLPNQMAADGSFPLELKRTKPYGYSLFNLDAMATICQLLSTPGDDLWRFTTPDGRSIEKGIEFMYPFIADKGRWPFAHDVMYWEEWPVAQPALVFGAEAFGRKDWLETWARLDHQPENAEVIRNLPVRHPLIWIDRLKVMDDVEKQTRVMLKEIDSVKVVGVDLPFSPRTIENGKLKLVASRDWTSGYFPGELWMLYHYTGSEEWGRLARQFTAPMEREKTNGATHDMGLKIDCSFGLGYRYTKDPTYRQVMIDGARVLSTRFNPKIGCIRSWDHHRELWQYPVIIDNMMNLELLFEATRLTGDSSFYRIAVSHANTTMKNHFRKDYSSYHVVEYDTVTAQVRRKMTWQGYSDSSAWARGQSWGLYGYTMCYRYTHDPRYLRQAEHIAEFILHHPRLPVDKVPYWDYDAPGIPRTGKPVGGMGAVPGDAEPRDASAAAVLASGLYELSRYSGFRRWYRATADTILSNLTKYYRAPVGTDKGFILLHSTGGKPTNTEVDVPLNYADYYYLEAILRSVSKN